MVTWVVDWFLDVLSGSAASLGRASAAEVALAFSLVTVVGLPFLVLVHELGHALAVRFRRLPLEAIVVGDAEDLIIRAGGVLMRFGRTLDNEGPAGFVRYDASKASVSDVIVIALAGPLANAIVAPALALLALIGGTHGPLDACLWILSAASVLTASGNLIPRGRPGTSDLLSDGRIVQLAWAARHMPAGDWTDVEAQPPAPSLTPPAPSERPGGMRWPFAAALLFVAVVAFVAGGAALIMPLVVLFGGALLHGAHRHKAW